MWTHHSVCSAGRHRSSIPFRLGFRISMPSVGRGARILLECSHVEESLKDRLRAEFGSLDPVALLMKEIREA
jgi:hypothetical protein